MLANVNRTFLIVLFISILLIGIIIGITILAKSIISLRKNGNSTKLMYTLVSIFCVIIAILSWVINMGWIRIIMTFLTIPIVHTVAFMIINSFSLSYVDKSVKLKRYIVLSYITYLLSYILLPDAADVGPMYVFFGLIHNDIISDICFSLSSITFIGNIAILILQIVERLRTKKTFQKTT